MVTAILHFAFQVAAMKADSAKQEEETKEEEQRRQERMHQLRSECEEFNRCPQIVCSTSTFKHKPSKREGLGAPLCLLG